MASCKYLPGTCYTCQKCLYCFKPPLRIPCTCPKEKRRTRDKNPQQGRQIYQRVYKPNQPFPKAKQFLFNANIEFGYESNFEESFSYTFCSACNSKNQRLRNKDREVQAINDDVLVVSDDSLKELDVSVNLSSKVNDEDNDDGNNNIIDDKNNGEIDDNDYDDGDENDEDDEEEEEEVEVEDDDEIKEIKVQIIVKSKTNVSPAKILSIQPVNYYNVKEKIILTVQKIFGKKIKSNDYTISYKASNSRGPSNILEDELDFDEFISEYKKVILSGKKMAIMVDIKDDRTKKKGLTKRHKKVVFFYFVKLQAK